MPDQPRHRPPHASTATKLVAEALGTFLLVFGSIGTALFASDFGVGANGTLARRSASSASRSRSA